MKISFPFRFTSLAAAASLLTLAACSNNDIPAPPPAVDQGQVNFINAAAHIAPTTLRFLVDNTESASLAYATGSGYRRLNAGSRALQVAAGTQTALTQTLLVEKDKSYTFIATPTSSTSTVGPLLLTDDLTTPGTGKARIRLVNLGDGTATDPLPSPLRLSQITSTVNGPVVSDLATNVASGTASPFVEFNANVYTLSVLDGAGNTIAVVGDGTGTGTGTYKYMEGKIYTVVLSGTKGSLNSDRKIKAYQLPNN